MVLGLYLNQTYFIRVIINDYFKYYFLLSWLLIAMTKYTFKIRHVWKKITYVLTNMGNVHKQVLSHIPPMTHGLINLCTSNSLTHLPNIKMVVSLSNILFLDLFSNSSQLFQVPSNQVKMSLPTTFDTKSDQPVLRRTNCISFSSESDSPSKNKDDVIFGVNREPLIGSVLKSNDPPTETLDSDDEVTVQ